jgi:hypothetical protein
LDGAAKYSIFRKNKLFTIVPSQRVCLSGRGAEMIALLFSNLQPNPAETIFPTERRLVTADGA